MSWLKKLFGAGGGETPAGGAGSAPEEEYKGFVIRAPLMPAGSEYQLAGTIEKDVAGVIKRHEFVRADRFSSKSDAQSATLAKGRQIIDEQGERVFEQTWPVRPN
jgi:hypothetical protein